MLVIIGGISARLLNNVGNSPGWLVVFAEEIEASVGDGNAVLVWIDGAEGEVLGWCGGLGEDVEESRLSDLKVGGKFVKRRFKLESKTTHVWHTNNADLQIGTNTADQRLDLRNILLLRRHVEG
jgi:hypothetical protein